MQSSTADQTWYHHSPWSCGWSFPNDPSLISQFGRVPGGSSTGVPGNKHRPPPRLGKSVRLPTTTPLPNRCKSATRELASLRCGRRLQYLVSALNQWQETSSQVSVAEPFLHASAGHEYTEQPHPLQNTAIRRKVTASQRLESFGRWGSVDGEPWAGTSSKPPGSVSSPETIPHLPPSRPDGRLPTCGPYQ